jgi:hypothetical protein
MSGDRGALNARRVVLDPLACKPLPGGLRLTWTGGEVMYYMMQFEWMQLCGSLLALIKHLLTLRERLCGVDRVLCCLMAPRYGQAANHIVRYISGGRPSSKREADWVETKSGAKTYDLTGLPPGEVAHVMVAAVGADCMPGPWSEIVALCTGRWCGMAHDLMRPSCVIDGL